jgi:hypothetical protein
MQIEEKILAQMGGIRRKHSDRRTSLQPDIEPKTNRMKQKCATTGSLPKYRTICFSKG